MKRVFQLTVYTPCGKFETRYQQSSVEDSALLREIVQRALDEDLQSLTLNTIAGDVYFPLMVIKNSVFQLNEQEVL